MKKINWLLEKYIFENYEDRLIAAIENSDNNVIVYDDSEKPLETILKKMNKNDIIIMHSSLQDGQKMLRLPYYPGIFLTLQNYECYNYYGYFGDHLLNSNYLMMGINDLLRRKNEIFDYFKSESIFIRPSNGFKTFTGQVLPKDGFELKYDVLMKSYGGIDKGTLILIAPIQEIEEEYRFIVVDGKVISGSLYMNKEYREKWEAFYDKECEDTKAFNFAIDMSKIYQPDKAYTIDICRTSSNEYKIMELNSFCCASMYGNNYDKVVNAINKLCLKEWRDIYGI